VRTGQHTRQRCGAGLHRERKRAAGHKKGLFSRGVTAKPSLAKRLLSDQCAGDWSPREHYCALVRTSANARIASATYIAPHSLLHMPISTSCLAVNITQQDFLQSSTKCRSQLLRAFFVDLVPPFRRLLRSLSSLLCAFLPSE